MRYRLLETVREYSTDKLGDPREAERRHAEYFLALARSANVSAESEGEHRHELVMLERANLEAAIDRSIRTGDVELATRIAVSLETYWAAADPGGGMRLFERLLGGGGLPPLLRAQALRCYGGASALCGRTEQAGRAFEESLALFRSAGSRRDVAVLTLRIGLHAVFRGEAAVARGLLEESLELARQAGSPATEVEAVGGLGYVARAEGDLEQAIELFTKSAAAAARIGFPWWELGIESSIAECAFELGRLDESARHTRRVLEIARPIGDVRHIVPSLANLARIEAAEGEAAAAARLWGAIEAEEARAPIPGWEAEREVYAAVVLIADTPETRSARETGRRLTLDEAMELALA
jgi:tetratricopeptide (TPR) repeat protein